MHDPWTVVDLLGVLSNLGLGAIVFVIWYFGQKRQATLEMLIEQYRTLIEQDLEKFKVINEAQIHQFHEIWKSFRQLIAENQDTFKSIDAKNSEQFLTLWQAYREVNRETQDTMLLNVRIQSRLVEKLERMERDHAE